MGQSSMPGQEYGHSPMVQPTILKPESLHHLVVQLIMQLREYGRCLMVQHIILKLAYGHRQVVQHLTQALQFGHHPEVCRHSMQIQKRGHSYQVVQLLIPAREYGHHQPVRMVHIRHSIQIPILGHTITVRLPAVRHLIPGQESGHHLEVNHITLIREHLYLQQVGHIILRLESGLHLLQIGRIILRLENGLHLITIIHHLILPTPVMADGYHRRVHVQMGQIIIQCAQLPAVHA